MRRGKKNNSFTEALGKEISDRKVLGKAAKAKVNPEDEIFLSEFKTEEIIAEPIDPVEFYQAQVESVPKPNPKKKKMVIKKSSPKKTEVPKKFSRAVEPDSDFEKRIFAEADNDFFDEKPLESIGDNMRSIANEKSKPKRSAFRSKILEEKPVEKKSDEEENSPDFDPELHRKLSRAELAGVALSAIMMVYSFANLDKPLFFLALSLFSHLIRPLIGAFCGKYNRSVQNGLRSFSLVIFAGALVLLFMNS